MNTKRKNTQWMKIHADTMHDPKMMSIGFENERHYICICALERSGTLDQVSDESMLDYIVASRLRLGKRWARVKKALADAGLIDNNWKPLKEI